MSGQDGFFGLFREAEAVEDVVDMVANFLPLR